MDTTIIEIKPKRKSQKFNLNISQIRSLSLSKVPVIGADGKVAVLTNSDALGNLVISKPYRITLITKGAPTGFGVYVGLNGSTFEIGVRAVDKFVRSAIGSVDDLSLDSAFEKAREELKVIRETGEHPNRKKDIDSKRDSVKRITVRGCMNRYLERLTLLTKNGKVKESSVKAVAVSLSRLARPEVGIADVQIRDLDDAQITNAWNNVRVSAMKRSNRIPEDIKEKLGATDEWWMLDVAGCNALGITGKYIARVQAAGIAATEHTFGDAIRAINMVIEKEVVQAGKDRRQPELFWNPFSILGELKYFRESDELNDYYRKAQVRNPLGSEDNSLPMVLKTILARRDEQGGNNRVATDYLLITLLFGSRRSESACLKWFDRCTKDELNNEEVSWVWLAKHHEINPVTKRRGSQAFFHDTKSGEVRFLPVCYFAEQVLRQRYDEREGEVAELPMRIQQARSLFRQAEIKTIDAVKLAKLRRKVEMGESRSARLGWVFPARSMKARKGHYKDSKSILHNIRKDAGLFDISKEIDIGLTPHDLRRTLGRYASKLLSGKMVSQLLHHHVVEPGQGMAKVTELYTEQEWGDLREAMGKVEETIIASSPRVYNRLKGTDKARLDEVNDPPVTIFKSQKEVRWGE